MNKYAFETINSWDKFCKLTYNRFRSNKGHRWIFRGHKNGKSLQSSLERAVKYYPNELKNKKRAEERLLREFKRRYHQYSSDAPEDGDYLEWFSIMQH